MFSVVEMFVLLLQMKLNLLFLCINTSQLLLKTFLALHLVSYQLFKFQKSSIISKWFLLVKHVALWSLTTWSKKKNKHGLRNVKSETWLLEVIMEIKNGSKRLKITLRPCLKFLEWPNHVVVAVAHFIFLRVEKLHKNYNLNKNWNTIIFMKRIDYK